MFSHFFFFSSRRRHTRFDCDWSSDVCSSDLQRNQPGRGDQADRLRDLPGLRAGRAKQNVFQRTAHRSIRSFFSRMAPTQAMSNPVATYRAAARSEEHTSELQSQSNLVCRLLLEKKKKNK